MKTVSVSHPSCVSVCLSMGEINQELTDFQETLSKLVISQERRRTVEQVGEGRVPHRSWDLAVSAIGAPHYCWLEAAMSLDLQ